MPVTALSVLRVACVGDSITKGAGTTNWTTDAYPVVIGGWLGSKYQVKNFGVKGSTLVNRGAAAYKKTSVYAQALRFKPDIVVVALGTNDASSDFDPASRIKFQKDYESVIAAFRAANASVKVYPCLPPPRYASRTAILSDEVLPLIRSVARDEGLRLIDFYKPLSNHPELFVDGIHPNTEGTRLIASVVYRALTGRQAPVRTG